MIGQLCILLMAFRDSFPRGATFRWFVVAVMGFIVRLDHHGVSSNIRWLGICPDLYESFLAFFRSRALDFNKLLDHWLKLVMQRCVATTRDGAVVLIGDGLKVAKEAKLMPGVKKLHQESDNSGKAPWISGHHFGVVGILMGSYQKMFCVPVAAELHEGVTALRVLQRKDQPDTGQTGKTTIVTLMVHLIKAISTRLKKPCVAVLDAYFAVGPTFQMARSLMDASGSRRLLHIVTRAKGNIVAYEDKPTASRSKGRPRKYGPKLKLEQLFTSRSEAFVTLRVNAYGEEKTVSALCLDLLWRPIMEKIRFVLIKDGAQKFILMCSNLSMAPEEIIGIYACRFKIEVTFKMLKHVIGGLCYHFWTRAWKGLGDSALSLEDLHQLASRSKRLIAETMDAIEAFVNIAAISTGLLQILAIEHADRIQKLHRWWLRTYSSEIPSEEMVKNVIQHEYYHNFRSFKHTAIYRIIREKAYPSRAAPLKKAA